LVASTQTLTIVGILETWKNNPVPVNPVPGINPTRKNLFLVYDYHAGCLSPKPEMSIGRYSPLGYNYMDVRFPSGEKQKNVNAPNTILSTCHTNISILKLF